MSDPTKPSDGASSSTSPEAAERSSAEGRAGGPAPGPLPYLVLDPRTMSSFEMSMAVLAMLQGSRNKTP